MGALAISFSWGNLYSGRPSGSEEELTYSEIIMHQCLVSPTGLYIGFQLLHGQAGTSHGRVDWNSASVLRDVLVPHDLVGVVHGVYTGSYSIWAVIVGPETEENNGAVGIVSRKVLSPDLQFVA